MKGKKILALLIVVAMVVALVPATVFATGAVSSTLNFGSNVTAEDGNGFAITNNTDVAEGTVVKLTAAKNIGATPNEQVFKGWTSATGNVIPTAGSMTSNEMTFTMPAAAVTLVAEYNEAIGVTADLVGSTGVSAIEIVTAPAVEKTALYLDGSEITVKATVASGNTFGAFSVTGATLKSETKSGAVHTAVYTIAKDPTAALVFTYDADAVAQLTVSGEAKIVNVNGKTETASSIFVTATDDVLVKANVSSTKQLDAWTLSPVPNGTNWEANGTAITDATALAALKADSYTFTYKGTGAATISATTSNRTLAGTDAMLEVIDGAPATSVDAVADWAATGTTVTATEYAGKIFDKWVVVEKGSVVGDVSIVSTNNAADISEATVKFNVAADAANRVIKIQATYKDAAKVTLGTMPTGGTLVVNNPSTFVNGESIAVGTRLSMTATAQAGYVVTGLKVEPQVGTVTDVGAGKFTYVTANQDVTITPVVQAVTTITVKDAMIMGDYKYTEATNLGVVTRTYTNVPMNEPLKIVADAKENVVFEKWNEGSGSKVDSTTAASTQVVISAGAPTISAEYRDLKEGEVAVAVTIDNGTGAVTRNYASGTVVALTAVVPEGKELAGWEVTGEGSAVVNGKLTVGTAATTVTAIFEKIAGTYEVKVVGASATGSAGAGMYKEGDKVTVKYGTAVEGVTFASWKAEGITLTAEQMKATEFTFTMPASDVTITAMYEGAVKMATLTLDANGGTGTMAAIEVPVASGFYAPESTFTKEGHIFAGWALTNDYKTGDDVVLAGQYISITADMTFYAIWVDINTEIEVKVIGGGAATFNKNGSAAYTVTFDADYSTFIMATLGEVIDVTMYVKDGSIVVEIPASVFANFTVGETYELRIYTTEGYFTHDIKITSDSSPETGDNTDMGLWIALAIAALVCGVGSAYLVVSKKKVNN